MKKIIAGLFAVAAFTFSASAQDQDNANGQTNSNAAQGKHHGRGGGMQGMDKLNLTDAQKAQIKTINDDFKPKMQAAGTDNTQRQALNKEKMEKISAVLTADQKTQLEQFRKQGGMHDGNGANGMAQGQHGGEGMGQGKHGGEGMGQRGGDRMDEMKTSLGLSDDQVTKMKAGEETFRTKSQAIRDNSSLSDDQKKAQMESLRKDREASFKSFLTADQIAKMQQMKGNGNYKEKRKDENGKEKRKVKST